MVRVALIALAFATALALSPGADAAPDDEALALFRQFAAAQNERDLDKLAPRGFPVSSRPTIKRVKLFVPRAHRLKADSMSLNEKLKKWWDDTRERAPEVYEAYTQFVGELKTRDIAGEALKTGDTIPPFMLPNTEGKLVKSDELIANGPLVLSFFRGGWCPYCRLELQALQDVHGEVKRLGASLAAVTPDTAAALADDKRDNRLQYEVLSDVDNGVALLFGLTFRVPEFIRQLWLRLNIDLAARHGNSTGAWLLPVPATYIIDSAGKIRHVHIDSDFRRRMEPAEIVAFLDSRQ